MYVVVILTGVLQKGVPHFDDCPPGSYLFCLDSSYVRLQLGKVGKVGKVGFDSFEGPNSPSETITQTWPGISAGVTRMISLSDSEVVPLPKGHNEQERLDELQPIYLNGCLRRTTARSCAVRGVWVLELTALCTGLPLAKYPVRDGIGRRTFFAGYRRSASLALGFTSHV